MNKNKGFSGVELLLTVSFIAVGSAAVYGTYDYVNDKSLVSSEVLKMASLLKSIDNITSATGHEDLSDGKLTMMGVYHQSAFKERFSVKGIDKNSFKFNYYDLSSRQCTNLAMKSATFKNAKVKINNDETPFNPQLIVNACAGGNAFVEVVFNSQSNNLIKEVPAGTPKPPTIYAGEGTLTPDLPDRGDVPINLADAGKPVRNPFQPPIGTYTPPTYIVAENPSNPTGTGSNPGGIVTRPVYEKDPILNPPRNPPDTIIEYQPIMPPIPPRPPALTPNPPATGIPISRGNGTLNICRNMSGGGIYFNWIGNMMYSNKTLYTPIEYFNKYGSFGEYGGTTEGFRVFYNSVVNGLPSNTSLNNWKCTTNFFDNQTEW